MTDSPALDNQRLKRIELDIVPGRSLGPFRLGSSLWDIIQFLRDRKRFFPIVELKYSQEDPLKYDFIVALPSNGIHLRFDGSLQRLKSIECFDTSKVKLTYQNGDVSSSRTIPTFLLIYKSFGPTYPGEFDDAQSVYTLKYPGVSFTFPIPARHQNLYKSSSELPLEFPDGTTPIISCIYLYSGSKSWRNASVPTLSKTIAEYNANASVKYGKQGRRELESVIAEPTKGATLHFPMAPPSSTGESTHDNAVMPSNNIVQILLSLSTAQDILADLGKPSRVFYKEEDKMKIHSVTDDGAVLGKLGVKSERNENARGVGGAEEEEKDPMTVHPTDYFFNYFHLGLDILIDGGLHVCKKVVLHGNVPGHFDFHRYKRCPFQLVFSEPPGDTSNELVNVRTDTDEAIWSHVVTADMKISTMQKHIPWTANTTPWKASNDVMISNPDQLEQPKPVILTRGSSEQNPFGSTYLTGYDEGIVMEVMKNGDVPTIVLY